MTFKKPFYLVFPAIIVATCILFNAAIFANTPPKPNKAILIQDGDITITRKEALTMLKDMTAPQRSLVITNPDKFKHLLLDIVFLKKKANEAINLSLDDSDVVKWRISKSKNTVLARALIEEYKSQLKIPKEIELLAREYYDTNPKKFLVAETVKVSHILLSVKPTDDDEFKQKQLAKMKTVLLEIDQGLEFSDAVKKYSDDKASVKSNGIIEHFSRGRMVKPFEDGAFGLSKVGEISKIIETDYGYHIIQLIDKQASFTKEYQIVKDQLIADQSSNYIKEKTSNYTNSFNPTKKTVVYWPAVTNLLSEANKQYLIQ